MLPLEGIKVVELAIWLAGPVCAAILADCGADVIKVEHLESGGDPVRGWRGTESQSAEGPNWVFENMNRGKRAIALDLSQEQGREIVYELVRRADVLITNLRIPTLERLRMDYETLSSVNPRIVYGRATGYGPRGPDRDKLGYDSLGFWARSGIMAALGEPGATPTRMRGSLGDVSTGTVLYGGVMTALFQRERTGKGCLVDTSLLTTGAWIAAENLWGPLVSGRVLPKFSRENPPNPLTNLYRGSDGNWFYLCLLQTDRYWPALCEAIEREDLKKDPRFDTHQNRCQNNTALVKILDEAIVKQPMEEWGKRFESKHIAWGPISTQEYVIRDPQMYANNYFVEVDHPDFGRIKETAIPFQIEGAGLGPRKAGPEFGSSTEEVLLEIGYGWDDIARLKDQQVIL